MKRTYMILPGVFSGFLVIRLSNAECVGSFHTEYMARKWIKNNSVRT